MELAVLPGQFAVCRLHPGEEVPKWSMQGTFFSITRTSGELSIVCQQNYVPSGTRSEMGWRIIKVMGQLDFCLVGILNSLTGPLARSEISIFAISTFDTDYLLIK